MNYEDIGRAAYEYYLADCARFNAKKQRAIARSGHPCEADQISGETPCYYDTKLRLTSWCSGCLYVQPFHEGYMEAANRARKAKGNLTRYCKIMLWNEGN